MGCSAEGDACFQRFSAFFSFKLLQSVEGSAYSTLLFGLCSEGHNDDLLSDPEFLIRLCSILAFKVSACFSAATIGSVIISSDQCIELFVKHIFWGQEHDVSPYYVFPISFHLLPDAKVSILTRPHTECQQISGRSLNEIQKYPGSTIQEVTVKPPPKTDFLDVGSKKQSWSQQEYLLKLPSNKIYGIRIPILDKCLVNSWTLSKGTQFWIQ